MTTGPEPDRLLLERYVAERDPESFAELVRRHGPMVMGVCRRVLGSTPDAEDAFQATFLILMRKAGSLSRHRPPSGWLYAVASHVASRARAGAARRREREKQAMDRTTSSPTEAERVRHDLRPIIDEELGRLRDRFRDVVVLCYLEGKTVEEAARELASPPGSVKVWLMRARETLRKRLASRGVVLSAGLLGTLLAQEATAAVPLPAVTAGLVSANVTALMEGGLKAMILMKAQLAAAALAAATILAAGGGVLYGALAEHEAQQKPVLAGQKPASKGGLSDPEMDKLHRQLTRMTSEDVWSIPWQVSLREARLKSVQEKKPIALWIVDGTPLGPC